MKLVWYAMICVLGAVCAGAQTFTTVASFDGSDGYGPQGPLVQGLDGKLYGVASSGGGSTVCQKPGCGTVFEMPIGGTLTLLHAFDGSDGNGPVGLVLGTNGEFYGSTAQGVKETWSGSVFDVTDTGTLSTLASFHGGNYVHPEAPVVEGINGNFYGTIPAGGTQGLGAIFEVTPSGTLTTLHSFGGTDGEFPYAALVQATDGNLYGATTQGGTHQGGTIFRITPAATFSTIYNFCSKKNCVDGSAPFGTLVQGTDGNLYGTANYGGANNTSGCNGNGCGTVFRITTGGELTTVHSFCSEANCADGAAPETGLAQANDGSFYGTTHVGGTEGHGTVFRITSAGVLTTLHDSGTKDGLYGPLMQATDGTLFGTTINGGTSSQCASGCGTIYSLYMGLEPFVETVPALSKTGQKVFILGSDLNGATKVTFNGTAAQFTIVSPTEITTTVPAGATTGPVEVVTPSASLKSNRAFTILP